MKKLLDFLAHLISKMSYSKIEKIGSILGFFIGNILLYRRKETKNTIAKALPDIDKKEINKILNGMYKNLGKIVLESAGIERINKKFIETYIEFDGLQKVFEIMNEKKGAIAITAHIGNFEILGPIASTLGVPITVIVKYIKPKLLHEWWVESRAKFGIQFIPPKHSYHLCLQALERKRMVVFVLDQNMRRHRGIFVDFFSQPACTSPGPAILSAQTGRPVIPIFIARLMNGKHKIFIKDPIPPVKNMTKEKIREATQIYTKVIEDFIRLFPDQWIWLHRRWRTKPLEKTIQYHTTDTTN